MNVSGNKFPLLVAVTMLLVAIVSPVFLARNVSAAQITNRSLTLQDGTIDGGSKPGGVVKHLFTFSLPSGTSVGSIQFKYCLEARGGTCTLPPGLVTTAATLGNETGATGFTMVNTTNGSPYLTRTAAVATGAVSYRLDGVTNPTTTNQTFFVQITTFSSTDATTGATDTGTVAASTSTQIVLTGVMPESLIFCTGETISVTGGQPDCSTATPGAINFNQLFSPTDTAVATSQMAATTNAATGYNITVDGPTMTSGTNTIPAMTTAAASVKGVSKFGMNLMANTSAAASSFPYTSANVAPAPNGTNYKGQSSTGYEVSDTFKYLSGDSVAKSDNGGAGPTDSQIFTASYIVNVAGSQLAGTYTTTLTYICTPTF